MAVFAETNNGITAHKSCIAGRVLSFQLIL